LKQKLDNLEKWVQEAGQSWIGDIQQVLLPIKQVAAILILRDKNSLVEEKHRKNVCPLVTPLQLRQLLATFTPTEYGKRVPINVINAIKAPDEGKMLRDVDIVKGFQIRVVHYMEPEDALNHAVPIQIKLLVDDQVKKIKKGSH